VVGRSQRWANLGAQTRRGGGESKNRSLVKVVLGGALKRGTTMKSIVS